MSSPLPARCLALGIGALGPERHPRTCLPASAAFYLLRRRRCVRGLAQTWIFPAGLPACWAGPSSATLICGLYPRDKRGTAASRCLSEDPVIRLAEKNAVLKRFLSAPILSALVAGIRVWRRARGRLRSPSPLAVPAERGLHRQAACDIVAAHRHRRREHLRRRSATGFGRNLNHIAMVQEDLGYLQSLPGVIGATDEQLGAVERQRQLGLRQAAARRGSGRQSLVNYFEVTNRRRRYAWSEARRGSLVHRERGACRRRRSRSVLHRASIVGQPRLCGADDPRTNRRWVRRSTKSRGEPMHHHRRRRSHAGLVARAWVGTSDDVMHIPRIATGPDVALYGADEARHA